MKLLCTLVCTLSAAWSPLSPGSLATAAESASNSITTPRPVASLISDRVARQAALDLGWDLAHALGHGRSIPNAGRTIPEMG